MKKYHLNYFLFMLVFAASAAVFTTCSEKEKDMLKVFIEELEFHADDASVEFVKVESNVKTWTVTTTNSAGWIIIDEKNDGFSVSVEKYSEPGRDRIGRITVTAGEANPVTIFVTQYAAQINTLTVNPGSLIFGTNETGTKSAVISTNASNWDAEVSDDWLSLQKTGNTLLVNVNTLYRGVSQRSAVINITAGNANSVTLTVAQEVTKNSLSVNPTTITFSANEIATKTAMITTDATNWNATTLDDWLLLDMLGNTLLVTPKSLNTGMTQLFAEISITADDAEPVTLAVIQDITLPEPIHSLSISTVSMTFTAHEIETKKATIITDAASWNATTLAEDWLLLHQQGNELSVTPKSLNTGSSQRTATVSITAGNAEPVTLAVIQDITLPEPIHTLSVNTESITFSANETATQNAFITTNASSWSFTNSDNSWLTVTRQGSANTLNIKPNSQNTGTSQRKSTITVMAGNANPFYISVTQDGISPYPPDGSYTARRGDGLNSSTPSTWTGTIVVYEKFISIRNFLNVNNLDIMNVWADLENGKIFLDDYTMLWEGQLPGHTGTYKAYVCYAVRYNGAIYDIETNNPMEIKYNSATRVLDFSNKRNINFGGSTGVVNNLTIYVGIGFYPVSGSGGLWWDAAADVKLTVTPSSSASFSSAKFNDSMNASKDMPQKTAGSVLNIDASKLKPFDGKAHTAK